VKNLCKKRWAMGTDAVCLGGAPGVSKRASHFLFEAFALLESSAARPPLESRAEHHSTAIAMNRSRRSTPRSIRRFPASKFSARVARCDFPGRPPSVSRHVPPAVTALTTRRGEGARAQGVVEDRRASDAADVVALVPLARCQEVRCQQSPQDRATAAELRTSSILCCGGRAKTAAGEKSSRRRLPAAPPCARPARMNQRESTRTR
jgi:hypothetical protein